MAKRSKASDDDSFPLLTRVDELVESLRDLSTKALREHDADAIHDARVATRRLKAAIDLWNPVLSKRHRKPFARTLRDLRRRLGEMRDLDVMIEHLGDKQPAGVSERATAWLTSRLGARRDRARERASKDVSPARVLARLGTWWGVRREVEEGREATDSLLAESLHLQLDAFVEHADALTRRQDAPPPPDAAAPHDPHALRIAGKSLRYTLEMAAVEGHALPAGVMRTFKRMQESLGLWHDYVVLTERAMAESVDAMLAHHDAPLQRDVLALSNATLKRAEKHLRNVTELWTSKGEELAHAIRSSFPLTRDISPDESAGDPVAADQRPVEVSTSEAPVVAESSAVP